MHACAVCNLCKRFHKVRSEEKRRCLVVGHWAPTKYQKDFVQNGLKCWASASWLFFLVNFPSTIVRISTHVAMATIQFQQKFQNLNLRHLSTISTLEKILWGQLLCFGNNNTLRSLFLTLSLFKADIWNVTLDTFLKITFQLSSALNWPVSAMF